MAEEQGLVVANDPHRFFNDDELTLLPSPPLLLDLPELPHPDAARGEVLHDHLP